MLLGIKSKKTLFLRHVAIGALSFLIYYGFWLSRPEWSDEHRLWRATGDAGFILLFLTLSIGPLAKLWRGAERLLSWRRELGIWFFVLAILHTFLILDGWIQWELMRFLGYEFIPQLDRWAAIEPGFGLANLMGLVAVFWGMILAATSSDTAVSWLGIDSWKWLHYLAYVVFYLTTFHAAYFLFLHFAESFHRGAPDPNWFRWPLVLMAVTLVVLQISSFIKVVRKQRNTEW